MVPTKELQTFRTSTRGITCHKINPPALSDVFALMTSDYNVLPARASTSTENLLFYGSFASARNRKQKLALKPISLWPYSRIA